MNPTIYPRLLCDPMTLADVRTSLDQARAVFKHLCDCMNHSGPNLPMNQRLTIVEDEIKLLLNLEMALEKIESLTQKSPTK